MSSFALTLLLIATVSAGIGAQVLGQALKVPSIVFLLSFGILLGRDGLGWICPQSLGIGLEVIVSLAVAIILFEGGLTLDLRSLNRISTSLRNLVTFGAAITLLGGSLAAHYWVEFPWPLAFLYASLVVVTGPTVISPLLKQVQVERPVAALLEGEGILIDPIGAILAVLVLNVVIDGNLEPVSLMGKLLLRLGVGAAIGAAGGWGLGWFLKRVEFLSEELENLVVLAVSWDLYGLGQVLMEESGLMAVVVAGILVSSTSTATELRLLRRFKGQLTVLAVSLVFVLLAADLSLASIAALGWGSLWTVLTLMLLVRPLSVWLCTWGDELTWRQKLFVSWIGPKGIVSAAIASLFAIILTQQGISGGEAIKALVFLTIIVTVTVQGLTARPIAKQLGLMAQAATGIIIVGANPLARLVARLFKEAGEMVALIDTDADACQAAEADDLRVFFSSALNPNVLETAGLDEVGTFLVMTTNSEINLVLAQRVAEEFHPPRTLAVFPKQVYENFTEDTAVKQAFTSDFAIDRWNNYLLNGEVKLIETVLKYPVFNEQKTYLQALLDADSLVPLIVQRQTRLQVVQAEQSWQPDDRLICLVHDPRPKLLKWLSGQNPHRLSLESLAVLEEPPASLSKSQIPTVSG